MIEDKAYTSQVVHQSKENNIYVATLHSVIQTDFSGEIKHQFTYEIEVNNQIVYAIVIFQQNRALISCQFMIG